MPAPQFKTNTYRYDPYKNFRFRDGHGAHGQRDRGGSFGSAVRPRVAARAGRFGHSRRHNRSGRDRSSYRSALERGNGHTERNGLAFRPRRRAPDVDEVYNE